MTSTQPGTTDGVDIKPRSRDVTDGLEKAAARGMLRAVGMGDEDFAKSQIGIASSWNEITPCNLSLDRLAKAAKDGVHAAGGYPLEFGTISVSDGISMGHEGMHFSLVSREIIADSVETVMSAERLDGSVLLAGCDKSLPGMLMAAARLDLASVFLYAGTILPGVAKLSDGTEKEVTIIDAFEAVGACAAGTTPSSVRSARARARVAASTPRTRWRPSRRRWACPCQGPRHRPRPTAAATLTRDARGRPWSRCCARGSRRGRS
jgi:dihydroxy-acid dehydratase